MIRIVPPGHLTVQLDSPAALTRSAGPAYRGSTTPQPVTLTTGAGHVQGLTLPVTS